VSFLRQKIWDIFMIHLVFIGHHFPDSRLCFLLHVRFMTHLWPHDLYISTRTMLQLFNFSCVSHIHCLRIAACCLVINIEIQLMHEIILSLSSARQADVQISTVDLINV